MFNVKDFVRYRPLIGDKIAMGFIIEVLGIKDSIYPEYRGSHLYKIQPVDTKLPCEFIKEKNIIEAYSKYYEIEC